MVRFIAPLVASLVLSGLTGAAPARKRDSAIGEEVAVSAPDGIVRSDTAELASQLASGEASQTTSFDESAITTIDPAAIPTGDVTSGIESNGETVPAVTSTVQEQPLPTIVSSSGSYNFPSYGSGSSSWMVSYNGCVQQCMVQYPPPPTVISLPSGGSEISSGSIASGSAGSVEGSLAGGSVAEGSVASSSGSGNTWNVVVAVQKGVLRYSPFYVTAQPGDVIRFMWGAGPHTVTQSSAATPCNHSIGGFQSGPQNASFVFEQTVNSTDPIFFYCGVPGHCQKGMFGAINPPMAPGASTSVAQMMPIWASANPDIMQALNATNTLAATSSGDAATKSLTWGDDLDVSGIDPSLHAALAKDILFTRQVMAVNPNAFAADGKFNPTDRLNVPTDVSALLDQADQGGAGGVVNAAAGTTTATPAESTGEAAPTQTGAALSLRTSSLAVAAAAVVATFFAL